MAKLKPRRLHVDPYVIDEWSRINYKRKMQPPKSLVEYPRILSIRYQRRHATHRPCRVRRPARRPPGPPARVGGRGYWTRQARHPLASKPCDNYSRSESLMAWRRKHNGARSGKTGGRGGADANVEPQRPTLRRAVQPDSWCSTDDRCSWSWIPTWAPKVLINAVFSAKLRFVQSSSIYKCEWALCTARILFRIRVVKNEAPVLGRSYLFGLKTRLISDLIFFKYSLCFAIQYIRSRRELSIDLAGRKLSWKIIKIRTSFFKKNTTRVSSDQEKSGNRGKVREFCFLENIEEKFKKSPRNTAIFH